MLAYREVVSRAQVKSGASIYEFPFGNYSGFTPNYVFFSCRPADVGVYAVIQHLAFHGRNIAPRIIATKCQLKISTIKNAIGRLTKIGLIEKTDTDWLFFHQSSEQMVSASQLTQNNLGYYVRMHDLTDPTLTTHEILAMAIMHNIVRSTPQMDMLYIAKIFRKSEKQTRIILKALVSKGYLLRTREHPRWPYRYEIVPAAIRNRLTSQGTTHMHDLSTDKHNRTQDDLSNRTQDDRSILSINCISKYKPDSSNTHQQTHQALLRDPFLQKEMQDVVLPYTEQLAKSLPRLSEGVELELKAKNTEHTQALLARNKELRETKRVSVETSKKINNLEIDLSLLEIKKKKVEHGLNVWLPYTNNPRAALSQRLVPLNVEDINMLEGTVRSITPKFSTESQDKMAFCLLFNSLVKDVADRYKEKYRIEDKGERAKRDAIGKSTACIKSKGYELNVAVYPKSGKRLK